MPAEQLRLFRESIVWIEDQRGWIEDQRTWLTEQKALLERSVAAAETNRETWQRNAAAAEKMAAELAKPPANTSNLKMAEWLLVELAPAMSGQSPAAVVARVRDLIAEFRRYYPATSVPAPR
jgi:hypothetical protein